MACECDIFVSGRLALFGEHSDWAGEFSASNPDVLPGQCLVVGTQEGVHARARRLPNEQVGAFCIWPPAAARCCLLAVPTATAWILGMAVGPCPRAC